MSKRAFILVSVMTILLLPAVSQAVDRVEEQSVTPQSEKLFASPERPRVKSGKKKIRLEAQPTLLEKGQLKFLVGLTQGFDTNASLDSQKEQDFFAQNYLRASFATPLSAETLAIVDYELLNLLYAEESYLDILRNGLRAGVEHRLSDEFFLSAGYGVDYVDYLNKKEKGDLSDDYVDNVIDVRLRQQLPAKLYHSISYELMNRSFMERYTRLSASVNNTKKRMDWRNTIGYEIGKYFAKDLVKVRAEYFNNNSNEQYLKYYDYDSYRIGGSFTHLFNNKISGLLSAYRQWRDYRSRTLINDPASTELEKTDLITAAIFYTQNKSLSYGLNYTYRENNSNEPVDSYSGSLVSVSTYIKF